MQYTSLGRTGLQVSRLCLGTMNFGPQTSEADSFAIMDQALAEGINFFDTANVYSDGTSEEIVGRALHDFARREEVGLATKVHGVMPQGPNGPGLSRKAIMFEIDARPGPLGPEYADL